MKDVIKQNVGIDVSKDTIDAALSQLTGEHSVELRSARKFSSTEPGFNQMSVWLTGKTAPTLPLHFTMEATGVYYESLAYFLQEHGYSVHAVLPNHAKSYAQSSGIRSKTDKLDSKMLAQMGLERQLRPWQPCSSLPGLKQLTRERGTPVCTRTAAANSLHAYSHQGKPNKDSIDRTKKHIEFLDAQIRQIEDKIKQFVNRDKDLQYRMKYVLSIPGVGLITAATAVAETNGFAAVKSIRQLTGYAGLDVKISESGKWKGKSTVSKRGNSHIRKALYFPAISHKTNCKTAGQFFDRINAKSGSGPVATVASMRKLPGLMFALWKKKEMFRAS